MPRKAHIVKREIVPDPMYQQHAGFEVRELHDVWRQEEHRPADPLRMPWTSFRRRPATIRSSSSRRPIENVKPVLEVKSRRVGGSTYQVPVEVGPARRTSLASAGSCTYSRARGEKSMEEKLAGELIDAANNRGNSIKKKEDTHRMAEANKAFAHYRW